MSVAQSIQNRSKQCEEGFERFSPGYMEYTLGCVKYFATGTQVSLCFFFQKCTGSGNTVVFSRDNYLYWIMWVVFRGSRLNSADRVSDLGCYIENYIPVNTKLTIG